MSWLEMLLRVWCAASVFIYRHIQKKIDKTNHRRLFSVLYLFVCVPNTAQILWADIHLYRLIGAGHTSVVEWIAVVCLAGSILLVLGLTLNAINIDSGESWKYIGSVGIRKTMYLVTQGNAAIQEHSDSLRTWVIIAQIYHILAVVSVLLLMRA